MSLRDHKPIVIEEFNGLWQRGDPESVPLDHFSEAENVQYGFGLVRTRDGLQTYLARGNPLRMYNYVMPTGDTLLILDTNGDVWHTIGLGPNGGQTTYGPILHFDDADDFGFVQTAGGYAYITPFKTITDPLGRIYQVGVPGEFLYVYKGDGTPARKAAGFPPTNGSLPSFVAYNSDVDGSVTQGVHIFAIDNGSGDFTVNVITAPGDKQVHINNLPDGTSRFLYATKAIDPKDYTADLSQQFYEVQAIDDGIDNLSVDFSDGELTVTAAISPPLPDGLDADNTDTLGYSDPGLHIFAVVYETDTGYLTAPGPEFFATITSVNNKAAFSLQNIPVSPDSFVVARHIVASKAILNYNGDQTGYQLFFVPDGRIPDNTTTTWIGSFYDADLLEDASHLIENFSEIPAGVGLTTYHGRLIIYTTAPDISLIGVSAVGEPEAINQVDGILQVPRDGDPITNAQEFRDVLYVFKKTRTMAFNDNGDVPSSWPFVIIDNGVGAAVHGISKVLDSDGVNLDFLLICDFSGLMQFNGAYARPELSWKIYDYWKTLDRDLAFANMQIMNDSLNQRIYISLPNKQMLYADYDDGLNAKDIKWAKWRFDVEVTTIALVLSDTLLIGSRQVFTP